MIRFEIKKILSRFSGKLALVLLATVLVFSCYIAVSVDYTDENGDHQGGITAVRKLRSMQKEWAGVLDEEMLRKVIAENQRIISHPDYRSHNIQKSNAVYHMGQGIQEIRWLISLSYGTGFRTSDYYTANQVTPDQAPCFYENRTRLLAEWLSSDEAKDKYSQAEKDYLINQYETLETPFKVDYVLGWNQLSEKCSSLTFFTVIILAYLLSGLFAGEFQMKTDSIFFSSYHGRKQAVSAKVKAGFLLVTVVYWMMWLLYSGFVLAYLGADGAATPIQSTMFGWKSFYHISQWQKYLLLSFGGYVGTLFISALTMLVSAGTRSSVMAALVPWFLTFLPSFLDSLNFLDDILVLFPDRLLNLGSQLRYFDVFEIGGKVIAAIPVQFALYIPLSFILLPVVYQTYRKKQLR